MRRSLNYKTRAELQPDIYIYLCMCVCAYQPWAMASHHVLSFVLFLSFVFFFFGWLKVATLAAGTPPDSSSLSSHKETDSRRWWRSSSSWNWSRHLQKLFVCFLLLPSFLALLDSCDQHWWLVFVVTKSIDRSTINECNEVSSIKLCSLANYQYGCGGGRVWESFGFDFSFVN